MLPHGTQQHGVFFFLPNLSYFECERRNQRQTLSQKRGGGRGGGGRCAHLLSSSVIYQSAPVWQPAEHLSSLSPSSPRFTFCLLRTAPRSPVSPVCPEQMCSQEDLYLPGSVWDICHAGIPFMGIFGDLENIVCFSLKPTYSGA